MAFGVWDLSHLYKTNDEFLADLKMLEKYLENAKKFKNKLNKNNADDIIAYFVLETKLSLTLEKLAVYAFCKQDDDSKNDTNVKNYAMINDICSKVSEELAFSKTELASLDEEYLKSLKTDGRFADYDRVLEDIIRYKKHTLSEKEEQNLAIISGFNNTDDIFKMLSDIEMDHGSFVDEDGKTVKLFPGNYSEHMHSNNPAKRRTVMETYLGKYAELNQTLAGLFTSHVKYKNYLAKCYNFESVLDMKTYAEEVSPEIMMINIQSVKKRVGLLQEYFRLKKKLLNLDEFMASDISVDIAPASQEKISYEQAISDIKESFRVLGDDYVKTFEEAVENGWIDAYPRENKRSGGYTISTYAEHPYILLNFDGTFEWASAIAHEFGHAMHSYYAAKSQPYSKYEYTLFVAEVVSLTNEILYNKYLLTKTQNIEQKIMLISSFLQLFELNVYDSSMLAEFELFAHDKLQVGESLTAKDYNEKFVALTKEYFGDTVTLNKGYECNWSRKGHIYRDYYLYKYSLGLSVACSIAKNLLEDKTGESLKKYKEFLNIGGAKDPISSLKVAGIDVLDAKFYDGAFAMFEEYLNELKNLTKEKI